MRITVISLLLCLLFLAGCAAAETAQPLPELTPKAEVPEVTPPAQREPEFFDPSSYLLGFVVKDSSDFKSVVAEHAFLRNAENIGYPSKIYNASQGIALAVKDGCAGLLVQGSLSDADSQALRAALCKVVALSDSSDADVLLYEDVADCSGEAARAMGEELIKRKVSGGSVVVIPAAGGEAAAKAFMDAFAKNYPQFIVRMQTAGMTDAERVLAVQQAVGVYCMDPSAADAWVKARDEAVKELTPSPTPKPAATKKPAATPKPSTPVSPTPSPTPAPHQAVKSVVIIATDYTTRNMELLESDGVYAIVARPYFEGAAQGALMLDRLLRGAQTPEKARLNVPIVRKSALDKYKSIVNEAMEWMGKE